MSDLIERLRNTKFHGIVGIRAADQLEAQQAEIARLRDLIAIWRRGPVQAMGAAISLQSQSKMEAAYAALRDEMDRLAIDIALEQKP